MRAGPWSAWTSTPRSPGLPTTGWALPRPGWSRAPAISPATSARAGSGSTWWPRARCAPWRPRASPGSPTSRRCGRSGPRWAGTSATPNPPPGRAWHCCLTGSPRPPARSSTPTAASTRSEAEPPSWLAPLPLRVGGVTLVLLVRHGLTAATGTVLTGRMPGISLDDRGREQARALGDRLAGVHLDAIVTSTLERCQQTAAAIAAARDGNQVAVQTDERFAEVGYGDWTGQPLKRLAKEPLWRVVQAHPSAVRFPGAGGESLAGVQERAVAAIRDWNERLGPKAVYLVCSHGDVIKSIIADSLGMHLDMFQRIQVDPCSLSVIRYTPLRPFVIRMNDTGATVASQKAETGQSGTGAGTGQGKREEEDAVVGG